MVRFRTRKLLVGQRRATLKDGSSNKDEREPQAAFIEALSNLGRHSNHNIVQAVMWRLKSATRCWHEKEMNKMLYSVLVMVVQ